MSDTTELDWRNTFEIVKLPGDENWPRCVVGLTQ